MTDEIPATEEVSPNPAEQDAAGGGGDLFPVHSPPKDQASAEEILSTPETQATPAPPQSEIYVAEPQPPEPAARRLSREDRQAYERTVHRFQACGRCGYLLADCRLALGEEALQQIILAAHNDWLTIEGTEALRPLLVKAFGIRLDQGFDYYDGLCPECLRRYTFTTEETDRIHLKIMI